MQFEDVFESVVLVTNHNIQGIGNLSVEKQAFQWRQNDDKRVALDDVSNHKEFGIAEKQKQKSIHEFKFSDLRSTSVEWKSGNPPVISFIDGQNDSYSLKFQEKFSQTGIFFDPYKLLDAIQACEKPSRAKLSPNMDFLLSDEDENTTTSSRRKSIDISSVQNIIKGISFSSDEEEDILDNNLFKSTDRRRNTNKNSDRRSSISFDDFDSILQESEDGLTSLERIRMEYENNEKSGADMPNQTFEDEENCWKAQIRNYVHYGPTSSVGKEVQSYVQTKLNYTLENCIKLYSGEKRKSRRPTTQEIKTIEPQVRQMILQNKQEKKYLQNELSVKIVKPKGEKSYTYKDSVTDKSISRQEYAYRYLKHFGCSTKTQPTTQGKQICEEFPGVHVKEQRGIGFVEPQNKLETISHDTFARGDNRITHTRGAFEQKNVNASGKGTTDSPLSRVQRSVQSNSKHIVTTQQVLLDVDDETCEKFDSDITSRMASITEFPSPSINIERVSSMSTSKQHINPALREPSLNEEEEGSFKNFVSDLTNENAEIQIDKKSHFLDKSTACMDQNTQSQVTSIEKEIELENHIESQHQLKCIGLNPISFLNLPDDVNGIRIEQEYQSLMQDKEQEMHEEISILLENFLKENEIIRQQCLKKYNLLTQHTK